LTFQVSCPTEIECSSANTGTVYVNACGVDPASASGVANVTVRAMDTNTFVGNAMIVDTALTIYVEATGADTGTRGAYFTINSGSSCGTGTITGFNNNEIIDSYNIVSVSPSSSANQNYVTGSGFRNSCWSC
jgi:hypothetical protein